MIRREHPQQQPARRSRLRSALRIAGPVLWLLVAAVVILTFGIPALDPVAMEQWRQDSRLAFLPVRLTVYVVVTWWGPVWRGVRGEHLDRSRLGMAMVCAGVEVTGLVLYS